MRGSGGGGGSCCGGGCVGGGAHGAHCMGAALDPGKFRRVPVLSLQLGAVGCGEGQRVGGQQITRGGHTYSCTAGGTGMALMPVWH